MSKRKIGWLSAGAASAVACMMSRPDVVAYCETGSEHPDNARFLTDCEQALGWQVQRLASTEYADTWDVWERRAYMAGPAGAPCTLELKVKPRLAFQRPGDVHVFGYTCEEVRRADAIRQHWPELSIECPLIDLGITKAGARAILRTKGIAEPVTYSMGLPHANCIPCSKASAAGYWALIRERWPDRFNRAAELSRKLGARLLWHKGGRKFIDELPADYPSRQADIPACDFACQLAEQDLAISE